mmetsp:Transcript_62132/g.140535  ORF Transcript_62132/g.140535 Transcript_62132/m.140535 type:complete len:520 (-) Transcript_62132:148-1707(-)|eukprot:CAMPEP_0172617578 /NCGR_PEP_ID=MMETSP1068-20121228/70331_1 /TAXON_ID=35684 /ORGANISM="Pseudopedinella elastica, Strain CCMP716" /LENGTH=519 /DNA_ID=CAMNT_0013423361 /DNA_START=152 /DNA_END=1711 /DNA_ORIENTATION=+
MAGQVSPSAIEGLARHEFDALNTLLLVVILGLCVLSSYLIKKYKCYYLPESAATLLVGLVVGAVARVMDPSKAELDFLSFDPEMFFFLLLPPIIFEAGYTLRSKQFFRNIGTIVAYAVFGTLVSTFVVGYAVFGLAKVGWIHVDPKNPMEAMMFGALISAVDPVATLSIMGNPELHCDPLLYSLVFGESVLNDAVAVVLFRVFSRYYTRPELATSHQVPSAVAEFVVVSLGSVAVGVAIGLMTALLFKHSRLRDYPTYEVGLLFVLAYGSYALSEALELSGIMGLFFCGVVMSHYNSYNLSEVAREAAEVIFHGLAMVSETFVFLLMGMGLFTGRFSGWSPTFILFAILLCLVSRLLNTFPISAAANVARHGDDKIPMKMQVMIWFAGLRGAIAFALSQNMPGPHKDIYETTTLGVIFFTTIICGGLTATMLSRTGMKRVPDSSGGQAGDEDDDSRPLLGNTDRGPGGREGRPSRGGAASGFHGWWRRVDASVMKPLFGGRSGADSKTRAAETGGGGGT